LIDRGRKRIKITKCSFQREEINIGAMGGFTGWGHLGNVSAEDVVAAGTLPGGEEPAGREPDGRRPDRPWREGGEASFH